MKKAFENTFGFHLFIPARQGARDIRAPTLTTPTCGAGPVLSQTLYDVRWADWPHWWCVYDHDLQMSVYEWPPSLQPTTGAP